MVHADADPTEVSPAVVDAVGDGLASLLLDRSHPRGPQADAPWGATHGQHA